MKFDSHIFIEMIFKLRKRTIEHYEKQLKKQELGLLEGYSDQLAWHSIISSDRIELPKPSNLIKMTDTDGWENYGLVHSTSLNKLSSLLGNIDSPVYPKGTSLIMHETSRVFDTQYYVREYKQAFLESLEKPNLDGLSSESSVLEIINKSKLISEVKHFQNKWILLITFVIFIVI